MKTQRIGRAVAIVAGLLLARSTIAQAQLAAANPIGVWRGTSLCLVHPSACHDEVVVYRIAPMKTADSVSFGAFKIVNGQEEEMGALACHVTAQGAQLTCRIPRGVWRFMIRGDSLVGELRQPDGTKFRDVRTARSR